VLRNTFNLKYRIIIWKIRKLVANVVGLGYSIIIRKEK